MSALQKAIRRGHEQFALRAAATLLFLSPEQLWRRCGCIAYEDIGVADFETLSLVTAALAGKRFRAQLGGEWAVASFIVARMVHVPKCRAADDLLLSAEHHPSLKAARQLLPDLKVPQLLALTTGSNPIGERALALWYAIGTYRSPSPQLARKSGAHQAAAFDTLAASGLPVVELAREGFRKVGEILCPFVSLLAVERQRESSSITDDELPPEILIRDVPSWAYDMYTREGRQALRVFLEGNSETARWVRAHIPKGRVEFLGTVLFRVEGGLCRKRLRWPTTDELRRKVDIECLGRHCPDATEILRLMRADIGGLNEVRSHAVVVREKTVWLVSQGVTKSLVHLTLGLKK